MKTMDIDELEDLAYRGAPVPELQSLAQLLLFQCLRELYRFAETAKITKEQGRREKQQILDAYRINIFLEELHESTQQLWKRIEIAATEYRKKPSIEAADKLLEAIYQVKRQPIAPEDCCKGWEAE